MILQEWMDSQGLNERQAAKHLGLSQQVVNRAKHPKRTVSAYVALMVARKTGGLVSAYEMLPLRERRKIYGNQEGRP